MKKTETRAPSAIASGLLLALLAAPGAAEDAPEVVLADFEKDAVGSFPRGWLLKDSFGRLRDRPHPNWRIAGEGDRRFLTARAEANAATIGTAVSWTVESHPLLRWSWRVSEVPRGANESERAISDSAAGLYVFFEGGPFWNPHALKYVWSASLPAGTWTVSPYSSNTHIVVVRSGMADANRWHEEERDVVADHARAFGDKRPVVKAIGLLTDSDNTESLAAADYGSVSAWPAGPSLD